MIRSCVAPSLAIVACLVAAACGAAAAPPSSSTASAAGPSAASSPAVTSGSPGSASPGGPSPTAATPSATAARTATPSASATASPAATAAAAPIPSALPGLEDWEVVNPQAVEIEVDGDAISMTLTRRALWFMRERGVHVGQPVEGDFRVTATVRSSRASDPSSPPGQDGTVQLGGLMARSPAVSSQNYVFVVVGSDADGLTVETKSTTADLSQWDGPDWDAADAELRLCRAGDTITAYKRHAGTDEDWTVAGTFNRPDLPDTLQVGPNIYSDSTPDLRVRFEALEIEPLTSPGDCTG